MIWQDYPLKPLGQWDYFWPSSSLPQPCLSQPSLLGNETPYGRWQVTVLTTFMSLRHFPNRHQRIGKLILFGDINIITSASSSIRLTIMVSETVIVQKYLVIAVRLGSVHSTQKEKSDAWKNQTLSKQSPGFSPNRRFDKYLFPIVLSLSCFEV